MHGSLAFLLQYLSVIIDKISKLGVGVVVTEWCKLKVRARVKICAIFFRNNFYFSFVRPNELQCYSEIV